MGLPAAIERPGIWLPRRRHLHLVPEITDVASIAFAHNVGTGVSTVSSTTVTIVPTQNTTGGNFVVLAWNGAATSLSSVTDPKGNLWATPITQGASGSITSLTWAWMDSPLLTTDTLTLTGSGTGANRVVCAMEFSGIGRGGGLGRDVTVGATGTTATAASSGASAATIYGDALVIGAIGWAGASQLTLTKGASYTASLEKDESSGAFLGVALEYKIVSATGTQTADGTISAAPTSWQAIVASFRAAGPAQNTNNRRAHPARIRSSQR